MLQPGSNLLVAGYVLYSSATAMVLSRKADTGVHMFTLDPTLGEYVMTRVWWVPHACARAHGACSPTG